MIQDEIDRMLLSKAEEMLRIKESGQKLSIVENAIGRDLRVSELFMSAYGRAIYLYNFKTDEYRKVKKALSLFDNGEKYSDAGNAGEKYRTSDGTLIVFQYIGSCKMIEKKEIKEVSDASYKIKNGKIMQEITHLDYECPNITDIRKSLDKEQV